MWAKLEDGERVIRLRGGTRGGFKSDQPHAGTWGTEKAYVLVPSGSIRAVNARVKKALEFDPSLENRSSEAEVLLLGSFPRITDLIVRGPLFCRARAVRAATPTDHLSRWQFRPGAAPRGPGNELAPESGVQDEETESGA